MNWLEEKFDNWWYELNSEIISMQDQTFLLRAIKWKFEDMSEIEKQFAENIYKWFKTKRADTYKTWDKKLKEILNKNYELHTQVWNKIQSRNSQAFSEAIKLAMMDLLRAVFSSKWVKIIKTSKYDELKCQMDYIFVWNYVTLGVDIVISDNQYTVINRKDSTYAIPIEFNTVIGNSFELKSDVNWWFLIEIDPQTRLWMKKIVVSLDPNLATCFFAEYMETISGEDNINNMWFDQVLEAWNYALDRYNSWKFEKKWFPFSKDKSKQFISNVQQSILNALNSR